MIGTTARSALNNPMSLNRAVVQVASAAAALSIDQFRELVQERFGLTVARREQFVLAQAACNATHKSNNGSHGGCSGATTWLAVRFHSLRNFLPRCWG
jgi:hypothetical protein